MTGPPPVMILGIPEMQELKVRYDESILVSPCEETEKRSIFLSNIDEILNYNVPTVHFFKADPNFPPETVVKRLRRALEKVLVWYDFMAGRFKVEEKCGLRLEIDCNRAGAGFVVASSPYRLDELGDLSSPNPGFRHLALQKLIHINDHDQPLCVLQVTSFKCGGFAMGMSTNHVLFDGMGAKTFFHNLASQAFHDTMSHLSIVPCHDRHLLAARSPPQVAFSHPEFFKPDIKPQAGPPVFDCPPEELDYKVFRLTPTAINYLKEKATMMMNNSSSSTTTTAVGTESTEDDGDAAADQKKNKDHTNNNKTVGQDDDDDQKKKKDHTTTTTNSNNNNHQQKIIISSLTAVASLIWRCKALSASDPIEKERVSTILNVIDIRSRLNPRLPESYSGNAVLVAYASAKCEEMEEVSQFPYLAEKMALGPGRVTEEYARSVIDWLEVNRGIPCGEYMVSSWMRLGLHEVEYPWGKPIHSGPVVSHRKDICWIFPAHPHPHNISMNALVSLPPPQMARFESHFRNFFPF